MYHQTEMLDREYMKQNYLDVGFGDLLFEVLSMFDQQALAYLSAIRVAFEQNDAAELSEQAHSLKGSAGSVGASAVSSKARDLEVTAKSGNLSAVPQMVSELEGLITLTNAAIAAELQRLAADDELDDLI